MHLELHPAAEAEARQAWLRYRAHDSAVATRFIMALDAALERIANQPLRWRMYLHGARRILVRRFPFSILYRVDPERVLIIAIAHQKRRPGYWQPRLTR